MIALDNRGAGRSPLPADGVSIPAMAEDAAAVLRRSASSPRMSPASRWAARSPRSSRSPPVARPQPRLQRHLGPFDAYFRRMFGSWIAGARDAASERDLLEAFFLWIYSAARTPTAPPTATSTRRSSACSRKRLARSSPPPRRASTGRAPLPRLGAVDVPALVLVGDEDITCPPRFSREVASRPPARGARDSAGRSAPAVPGVAGEVEATSWTASGAASSEGRAGPRRLARLDHPPARLRPRGDDRWRSCPAQLGASGTTSGSPP